jgi:SAM-dependent methyltransferase
MAGRYSPDRVRTFFDQYGDAEWSRYERGATDRVSLQLHRRLLSRWVRSGDRVLEVGAGPGRFTIELARLGARVVVGDISPRQLELNRQKVAAAGCEDAVESRQLLDVIDLAGFPKASFNVATAYGGPLSYVFEKAGQAIDQLLTVVRPGGVVLFSVMSRWGSLHQFLDGVLEQVRHGFNEEYRNLIDTGDLEGELARVSWMSLPHECHLFTWSEIEELLAPRPCRLLEASAANFLSIRAEQTLSALGTEEWERFLAWEERACRARSALDAGTHILVAIERHAT